MLRRFALPALLACLALVVAVPATAQVAGPQLDLMPAGDLGLVHAVGAEGQPLFLFDNTGACTYAGVVDAQEWIGVVDHAGPDHNGVYLRGDLGGQFIQLSATGWDGGGSW